MSSLFCWGLRTSFICSIQVNLSLCVCACVRACAYKYQSTFEVVFVVRLVLKDCIFSFRFVCNRKKNTSRCEYCNYWVSFGGIIAIEQWLIARMAADLLLEKSKCMGIVQPRPHFCMLKTSMFITVVETVCLRPKS